MSWFAPAPIRAIPAPPPSVRNARGLWLLSFVAGLAVLVGSFLTRESYLQRLKTVVEAMAPGSGAEAVTTATGIVFWGSLVAVLLVILLEAAILVVVMGRHGRARWVLLLLLAGHVFVLLVTAAFLVPDGDAGSYVVLLWGLDLLLAFVGLAFFFMPSASAWLKSGH
ncbi:hypothetical protein FBY31_1952 [Arthrobacter sp. SLBN-100]|uniref:hypothetical protein n=1 Tax=Arthrobacter sp. SLBN-100 TaxID=2768450 RepID=UPI001152E3C2|nr:hypothetical protein [Arthrobacter sp. SLBN-100]TQJ67873.1 hypothetical protein FBY31_1952 [Arthrobacter sp. SLBN-100]